MDLFDDMGAAPSNVKFSRGISKRIQYQTDLQGYDISLSNGALFFSDQFFNNKVSDRSFEYFLANDSYKPDQVNWKTLSQSDFSKITFGTINWKQEDISMFGKTHLLPRLTSWHGDSAKNYTYSGITSRPSPWNKGLLYIKERIERVAQAQFNSVLLNWYRSGEDHLNWHADDEKELGQNPIIASVSFGEPRDFVLRRNDDYKAKVSVTLGHGSLLIMRGGLQHFWQHSVPQRKMVRGSRINLTFRSIKN